MQAAQDQQKSYADRKQKPMEFEVGDRVMLKVSPWKGVVQFAPVCGRAVEIIEREIKRLKQSRIPLVKVRWNSKRGPEFTWEREDSFKQKYPQLFTNRATSSATRIMPPKSAPLTQAAVRRMIKVSADVAITAERVRHANAGNNANGFGPARGQVTTLVVRECTFAGFMKCNPDNFRGPALTWWNSKVAILGLDVANQMGWTEMKKLMTSEFCPVEELQRMENDLWNLKVKEYNMVAYTQRFNKLALMCLRMVEPESVKVNAYIRGLTDNIKGEVTSSKPTNLNEAVCMAHKLMEQKLQSRNERILEGNKRK
ncbi:putative reverse transcriptase domain-containing protein [Tanacetum coccineum]